MANETKQAFVAELERRFGRLRKLDRTQSLFELADGQARIYIRYSKVHEARGSGWYGLRAQDLRQLEGHPALVCFLWEGQAEPLLVPFAEYEPVIEAAKPASDGQYKVHILLSGDARELYIARIGRFNVEGHMGWNNLEALVDASQASRPPELSHQQVQTLLGAIGTGKGYDVWVPAGDRAKLDWSLCQRYECDVTLPPTYDRVSEIIREVDVLWVHRGSGRLRSAFEIEHSTPIYSGLLRFNDIHLVAPDLRPTYNIVANDARRELFARQLGRPTFEASGLSELCSFLEYVDVFNWHRRVNSQTGSP